MEPGPVAIAALLAHPRIQIRVTPSARKTRITRVDGEVIHLDVAAPPEDGKANREVERYLSKISGKKATVTMGATGKDKTVKLG